MRLASRWAKHLVAGLALAVVLVVTVFATTAASGEPQPAPNPTPTTESTSEPTDGPAAAITSPTPDQIRKALAAAKSATVKVTERWTREVLVSYPDDTIQSKQQLAIVMCSGVFVGDSTGVDNGKILTAGHCRNDKEVSDWFDQQIEDLPRGDFRPIFVIPGMTVMPSGGQAAPGTQQGGTPTVLDVGKLDTRIQVTQEKGLPGAVITDPVDARPLASMEFENGDQALIKIDGLPYVPAVKDLDRLPADGEEMWSIGYPGSMDEETLRPDMPRPSDVLIDPNANPDDPFDGPEGPYDRDPGQLAQDIANSRITVASLKGSYGGRHYVKGTEYLVTSAPLGQGMSGGGTFIFDGEQPLLVGLNSYGVEVQSINLITSPSSTRTFLEANGVQGEDTAAPAPSAPADTSEQAHENTASITGPDNLPWWLVPAFVLAGIIGGAGGYLISWRQQHGTWRFRHNHAQQEGGQADASADATAIQSDNRQDGTP